MPCVTEDNLTDVVLEHWKDIPDPRLWQIMESLIKHLHGFVRDSEPTQAEFATAIDWLTRTGKPPKNLSTLSSAAMRTNDDALSPFPSRGF
jgi:hypothetical protein